MICYAVIDTNVLVSALFSNHSDAATVQLVGRKFIVTKRQMLDILDGKDL